MIDASRIIELLTKGELFCLATVTASENPSISPGTKVMVLRDGTLEGGLGTAQLDETLRGLALEALAGKKKCTVQIEGHVRVFLDIFSEDVKLFICGAGHIALPLVRFAREVGFKVTVIDDRADFAKASRFPGCVVKAQDFVSALRDLPFGLSTYVVVITRGHEHDVECLAEVLRHETAYVGLIGSRRRVGFVLDLLAEQGISRERLREVFTPIGLSIGSESPAEIALSIVAELVCVRRKGPLQAQALRTIQEG